MIPRKQFVVDCRGRSVAWLSGIGRYFICLKLTWRHNFLSSVIMWDENYWSCCRAKWRQASKRKRWWQHVPFCCFRSKLAPNFWALLSFAWSQVDLLANFRVVWSGLSWIKTPKLSSLKSRIYLERRASFMSKWPFLKLMIYFWQPPPELARLKNVDRTNCEQENWLCFIKSTYSKLSWVFRDFSQYLIND